MKLLPQFDTLKFSYIFVGISFLHIFINFKFVTKIWLKNDH